MLDELPNEIIINILSHLNKRDLCKCSLINKKWNSLTYSKELWTEFSLTDIVKPKWCASKLVSIENTSYLIEKRFGHNITRVDLAKLCFSFETLDTLFQNCSQIKSLVINFKYYTCHGKYLVDQCIHTWPVNKLEKLYLKNVCDMKARRYCRSNLLTAYDIIELEIIKLLRILFKRNSSSLRVLGLKCVDPSVISSCVNNFENLEILLLNNINDTDSVLSEVSSICKKLKCLELTKCKDFHGDGLQELIEQIKSLETLQLGKFIYPTFDELNEINWSNLKSNLRELTISTKFPQTQSENDSLTSTSPDSDSTGSSSSSPFNSIDLYSKTLFNYLNDDNNLHYLALEDFTLKFPVNEISSRSDEIDDSKNKRFKRAFSESNLRYIYLRNIQNVKLRINQSRQLMSFLQIQYNLITLDLIGLYLSSDFICSILVDLKNLKVLNFGHGKSYKRSTKYQQLKHNLKRPNYTQSISMNQTSCQQNEFSELCLLQSIDVDSINAALTKYCKNLTHLGIFYRQSELKFKQDPFIEFKNTELLNLLANCKSMKQISYLKSFKLSDDDNDILDEGKGTLESGRRRNYFHYIRYAINNASLQSSHVNMKPCYGYDLTPSTGYLLEANGDFIETNLPIIEPPLNDFHYNLLNV